MQTPLSTKILPTRRAAQSATSSFRGQFDSSDSDGERDSRATPARGKGRGRGRGRGRGKAPAKTRRESTSHVQTPSTATKKRQHEPIMISDDDTDVVVASTPPPPSSMASLAPVAGPSRTSAAPCDLHKLGPHVWVLTTVDGQVFGDSDADEYIHWPAQNIRLEGGNTVVVKPYGNLSSRVNRLTVRNPTGDTILPLTNDDGAIRFQEIHFVRLPSPSSIHGSPRKKQKIDYEDLKARWTDAVLDVIKVKEVEDELPEIAFVMSTSHFGPSCRTEKDASDEDEVLVMEEPWVDPGPDELLNVPGEVVFARTAAGANLDHWPAQILGYVPSTSRKQKRGKYELQYLDEDVKLVPRDWFHALGDPEFGTCKLGQFSTDIVKAAPDPQTHWVDRPLPPTDDFYTLSMRDQFGHTIPVMEAILRNEYAPARKAIEMFMAGGSQRKALTEAASFRGKMSSDDVESCHHWVIEWGMREEKNAVRIQDEDDGALIANNDHEVIDVDASEAQTPVPSTAAVDAPPVHIPPPDEGTSKLEELATIALSVFGPSIPDIDEQVPKSENSAEDALPAVSATSVEDVKMDVIPAEIEPRVESPEVPAVEPDTAKPPTISSPTVAATEDVTMDGTAASESVQVEDLPALTVSKVEDALPPYVEAVQADIKACETASVDNVASIGETDKVRDVASPCGPEPHVNGSVASKDEPSPVPPPSTTEDVTMEAIPAGPHVSLDPHVNDSLVPEASTLSRATPPPPSSTISPVDEDVAMEVEDRDGPGTEAATHSAVAPTNEDNAASAPNEEPRSSRPRGFDQYEQLSQLNKIEFCQNILLPEAIKQILLWRNEKRTSLELLSDEREAELSVIGEKLLEERDWVLNIKNVREMMDSQKSVNMKELKKVLVGGTRSRPKHAYVEKAT